MRNNAQGYDQNPAEKPHHSTRRQNRTCHPASGRIPSHVIIANMPICHHAKRLHTVHVRVSRPRPNLSYANFTVLFPCMPSRSSPLDTVSFHFTVGELTLGRCVFGSDASLRCKGTKVKICRVRTGHVPLHLFDDVSRGGSPWQAPRRLQKSLTRYSKV